MQHQVFDSKWPMTYFLLRHLTCWVSSAVFLSSKLVCFCGSVSSCCNWDAIQLENASRSASYWLHRARHLSLSISVVSSCDLRSARLVTSDWTSQRLWLWADAVRVGKMLSACVWTERNSSSPSSNSNFSCYTNEHRHCYYMPLCNISTVCANRNKAQNSKMTLLNVSSSDMSACMKDVLQAEQQLSVCVSLYFSQDNDFLTKWP